MDDLNLNFSQNSLPNESESWSLAELLVLSHAILKYGNEDWTAISKALEKYTQDRIDLVKSEPSSQQLLDNSELEIVGKEILNSFLQRDPKFFTISVCQKKYNDLINDFKSDDVELTEEEVKNYHLIISDKIKAERLKELQESILKKETMIKTLKNEIAEIRNEKLKQLNEVVSRKTSKKSEMKKANSNLLEENLRLHSSQIIHENPQIFPLKSSIDTELLTTKKSEEIETMQKHSLFPQEKSLSPTKVFMEGERLDIKNSSSEIIVTDLSPSKFSTTLKNPKKEPKKKKETSKKLASSTQKILLKAQKLMLTHKYAYVFKFPVSLEEAPNYDQIIKHPMDLSTIKKLILDGTISTSKEFEKNLNLMFTNALTYNEEGSEIYIMTETMRDWAQKELQTLFSDLKSSKKKDKESGETIKSKGKRKRDEYEEESEEEEEESIPKKSKKSGEPKKPKKEKNKKELDE